MQKIHETTICSEYNINFFALREIHYVLERTFTFEEWEKRREWREINNEQTYIRVIWQWIMLTLNSEY